MPKKDIVLEVLPHAIISIERKRLTMKMHELWDDKALTRLSELSGKPLQAVRNMTWIAFLKSDIADKDIQGYKKHKKKLKDVGYDV